MTYLVDYIMLADGPCQKSRSPGTGQLCFPAKHGPQCPGHYLRVEWHERWMTDPDKWQTYTSRVYEFMKSDEWIQPLEQYL